MRKQFGPLEMAGFSLWDVPVQRRVDLLINVFV
jgi:hypothetical protein